MKCSDNNDFNVLLVIASISVLDSFQLIDFTSHYGSIPYVNFALLGAWYFCMPRNLLELCSECS